MTNATCVSYKRWPGRFAVGQTRYRHWLNVAVVWALAVPLATASANAAGLPGEIQFSDGEVRQGLISLSPGQTLQILDGKRMRTLGLESLREVRWMPASEAMTTNWFFPEAGRTFKETRGEPYPVRQLIATILTVNGACVTGHLQTLAFYIEVNKRQQKVVAAAKQQGKPGQTLNDLVYPSRLAIRRGETPAVEPRAIALPDGAAASEAAVLSGPALARLDVRCDAKSLRLPAPLDRPAFVGFRSLDGIGVAWPVPAAADDAKIAALVREAKDFFDRRELLAVWKDDASGNLYTLLMLRRAGRTTLDGERTQPWRCAVWRWKLAADGHALLAGGGYLFRGILAPGGEPPPVRVLPEWWGAASDSSAPGHAETPLPQPAP